MTVTLDQYIADVQKSGSSIIGSILWYTIAGTVERTVDGKRRNVPVRIHYDDLVRHFQDLGLDDRYLPPKIKKIDAFRVASSEIKHTYSTDKDVEVTFRCVEVDHNAEYVLRHVMRDVTNRRTEVVVTAQVATLRFYRGARSSSGKRHQSEHYKSQILSTLTEYDLHGNKTGQRHPLPEYDNQIVQRLLADFDDRYTDYSANLQNMAIRAVVRNYLIGLNAIQVKPSGGVYFVHNSRQPTLDALQELVKRIGQGCTFHQVPLPDTHEQREMLTEAFQSEVEDDCRLLLAAVAEANDKAGKKSGGKVSPTVYAQLNARYTDIQSRAEEYTRVLGLSQERAASALELALDSVMDIATRIDFGKAPR